MTERTPSSDDKTTASGRAGLRLDITLLCCSLLYILAEFIFNARLLDTASDITATADDLRDVEYLGRAVSGVGLSLLVAGFFARDRFRMSRLSDQIVFGLLALLCPLLFLLSPLAADGGGLDPAGVSFTQLLTGSGGDVSLDFPPPDASMMWVILPLIGIFGVLVAHYMQLHRVFVLAGVVMMTWPAMFFGQKIMIERFMVHPTTWETRLDARYMQVMRSGFGHGIIALRDLRFDKNEDPALRTFLVLMGSLFMQFPDEAKDMIREKQDDIVRLMVSRTDIQDIDARYAEYLAESERFRNEVYAPYQNASSEYTEILSEPYLISLREDILRMAREETDRGWLKMRDSIATCKAFASRNASALYTRLIDVHKNFVACPNETCRGRITFQYQRTIRDAVDMRVPYDYWCESSGITPEEIESYNQIGASLREVAKRETFACHPAGIERLQARLMPFCMQKVHRQSGFTATIRNRDDYEASEHLRKLVRDKIVKTLRIDKRLIGFMLPEDWSVRDVQTLDDALAKALLSRAGVEWKLGRTRTDDSGNPRSMPSNIKPGLSFDEFVRLPAVQQQLRNELGQMYYPGFSLSMTREEFTENVIAPDIKRRAIAFIREMEQQGKKFANGESNETVGKEAVRFIYIPSIALFISLFLVVLTLARCLITAARLTWRHFYPHAPASPLRLGAAWAVIVLVIAGFPYVAGSTTAQSESYQGFLKTAIHRAPVSSALLDWTMRAEPIIYSAGKSILNVTGFTPPQRTRNTEDIVPVVVFDRQHDEMLRRVQAILIEQNLLDGAYGGGIMNDATHEALRRYQKRYGLKDTGVPDKQTLEMMDIPAPAGAPADESEQTAPDMPDTTP